MKQQQFAGGGGDGRNGARNSGATLCELGIAVGSTDIRIREIFGGAQARDQEQRSLMGDEFGGVGVHCKWQPWNPYLRVDGRNPGKRNGSRNVTEWTCIVHWRVGTAISVCGQRECVELSGEREREERRCESISQSGRLLIGAALCGGQA